MKFLKFSIVALLMIAVFSSCKKEKDVITFKKPTIETPIPPSPDAPIKGTWIGNRHGIDRSVPYSFGFQIKEQGKLDVLNPEKGIIGSGEWKFENNVFAATYTLLSGEQYSVKSDSYDPPGKLSGTWGHGDNHEGSGFWNMKRVN